MGCIWDLYGMNPVSRGYLEITMLSAIVLFSADGTGPGETTGGHLHNGRSQTWIIISGSRSENSYMENHGLKKVFIKLNHHSFHL